MSWLPRTLGLLTAAYGPSTLVRPSIFAKPAGLSGEQPPDPVAVLVRAVGVREVANGLALAAPRPDGRCGWPSGPGSPPTSATR
jgi:hypothetical protein